jgi:NADPH:quinone reductase-like Zn-dependent oxidoreductase
MPVIKGYSVWLTTGDETKRKAAVEYILRGLESGALKPVIDRTFSFNDMVKAHRYLEDSGQFGKIVVSV